MRSLRAMVLVFVVAGAAWPSVDSASASTYCGSYREADGARVAVARTRGGVSCAQAKAVLSRYGRSVEQRACRTNACPRLVRGFASDSASAAAFPRLFSCRRGSRVVSAYSTAH